MKTINIELSDELLEFVCADAQKMGLSTSEYLGVLAEECRREALEYEASRQAFFAIKPFHFEWVGGRRPTREELYDRPCLR